MNDRISGDPEVAKNYVLLDYEEAMRMRQSALAFVDAIERIFMPDQVRTKEIRDEYKRNNERIY